MVYDAAKLRKHTHAHARVEISVDFPHFPQKGAADSSSLPNHVKNKTSKILERRSDAHTESQKTPSPGKLSPRLYTTSASFRLLIACAYFRCGWRQPGLGFEFRLRNKTEKKQQQHHHVPARDVIMSKQLNPLSYRLMLLNLGRERHRCDYTRS